jgi:hypothetical protein
MKKKTEPSRLGARFRPLSALRRRSKHWQAVDCPALVYIHVFLFFLILIPSPPVLPLALFSPDDSAASNARGPQTLQEAHGQEQRGRAQERGH